MLISPKNKGRRISIIVILLVFPFLIFFSDELVGSLYFKRICENTETMEVLNTVKLEKTYWDNKGAPKFFNEYGFLDFKIFGTRFKWRSIDEPYISGFINIVKTRWVLFDTTTQQNLGEKVTLMRKFGWLQTNFSLAPNIGEGCSNVLIKKYGKENYYKQYKQRERDFALKIFIKQS